MIFSVGGMFLQKQSGNFLLQALLALTLVFSFMPFVAQKLSDRDSGAKMYAAKKSIETVYDAARSYLYDNKDSIPYSPDGKTPESWGNNTLVNKLKPYGLPEGFVPKTALDQSIRLDVLKTVGENNKPVVSAKIVVTPNASKPLKEYQVAELSRMIGFFASPSGENNTNITVFVPVDVLYTDIVMRNETNSQIGFLTELNMGGHSIRDAKEVFATSGEFDDVYTKKLYVNGNADGLFKDVTKIQNIGTAIFKIKDSQCGHGTALSIGSGGSDSIINLASMRVTSVGNWGGALNVLSAGNAEVGKLSFTESGSGFVAGETVDLIVDSLYVSDLGAITIESLAGNGDASLEVGGTLYAVGKTGLNNISDDILDNFEFNNTGMYIGNAVMNREHNSSIKYVNMALSSENKQNIFDTAKTSPQFVIDLAGVSKFDDIIFMGEVFANNEDFAFINYILPTMNPEASLTATTCENVLTANSVFNQSYTYNSKSLAQMLACEYVFFRRLEHRINYKLCCIRGDISNEGYCDGSQNSYKCASFYN